MIKLFKISLLFLLAFLLFTQLKDRFMPDITDLRTTNPERTAFMGDKRRRVQQHWVRFSQIALQLKHAVIVAEDGSFYQHKGVDFHELKESIKKNIDDRSFSRGFSTITMQLARNLYLSPKKTMFRKLKEIMIAWWLERELRKDRILELYLNVIEWGRGIYGAEAAARHYFNKSAAMLSTYEAAYLAAIIPSPQRYGRLPPGPYIEKRIEVLLHRMQARWRLTED